MNNNFWIKVYLNNLDDPDICTLPDRLYRRLIELNLLAGRLDSRADGPETDRGLLPDTKKIAFALRLTAAEIEEDLRELEQAGFVCKKSNGWLLPGYAEQQAPISAAERNKSMRRRRERETVTSRNTERNETVTSRNTDTETDTTLNIDTNHHQTQTEPTAQESKNGGGDNVFNLAVDKLQTHYARTGQKLNLNHVIEDNSDLVIGWADAMGQLPEKPAIFVSLLKRGIKPEKRKTGATLTPEQQEGLKVLQAQTRQYNQ